MSTPAQPQGSRAVQLSEQPIDAEWTARWRAAKAQYPDELLQYAGHVRGLFASADAPISASDGKVFIVYRSAAAGDDEVHVEGVYSNIPAANEHVMLCFAREYGDRMAEGRCRWVMKGAAAAAKPAVEVEGELEAEMVWSYTPHACLELEVMSLPSDDASPGPCRVYIVEEWIEDEPPEDLELSVLGKRP